MTEAQKKKLLKRASARVNTVAGLIEALSDLPPEMGVDCGSPDGVQLVCARYTNTNEVVLLLESPDD